MSLCKLELYLLFCAEEIAAESFNRAAEYYQTENESPRQSQKAAQTYAKLAVRPSVGDVTDEERSKFFRLAIEQMDFIQVQRESEAKWESAQGAAQEKAQYFLELGEYQEAASTYLYIASELSQSRVELVNRFLVFAAGCHILLGREEDAQNLMAQAVQNFIRGNEHKGWGNECYGTYVLCCLCLGLSDEKEWTNGLSRVKLKRGQRELLEEIKVSRFLLGNLGEHLDH